MSIQDKLFNNVSQYKDGNIVDVEGNQHSGIGLFFKRLFCCGRGIEINVEMDQVAHRIKTNLVDIAPEYLTSKSKSQLRDFKTRLVTLKTHFEHRKTDDTKKADAVTDLNTTIAKIDSILNPAPKVQPQPPRTASSDVQVPLLQDRAPPLQGLPQAVLPAFTSRPQAFAFNPQVLPRLDTASAPAARSATPKQEKKRPSSAPAGLVSARPKGVSADLRQDRLVAVISQDTTTRGSVETRTTTVFSDTYHALRDTRDNQQRGLPVGMTAEVDGDVLKARKYRKHQSQTQTVTTVAADTTTRDLGARLLAQRDRILGAQ